MDISTAVIAAVAIGAISILAGIAYELTRPPQEITPAQKRAVERAVAQYERRERRGA